MLTDDTNEKPVIKVFKSVKTQEPYYPTRDPLNLSHPVRCMILAPPNAGKTNMIKNLLISQNPPFQRIYLFHPDIIPEEYSDIDYIPLDDFPDYRYFDKDVKNLVIFDDVLLKAKSEEAKKNLNKLLSFTSTHLNTSIFISLQDKFSQGNVSCSRFCDCFILFKFGDVRYIQNLASLVNIDSKKLRALMDDMEEHDSLMFYKKKIMKNFVIIN